MTEKTLPTTSKTEALFTSGDFEVVIRKIKSDMVPEGFANAFAIRHVPTDVIAGYGQQLAGMMQAAQELDLALRKALASVPRPERRQ